MLIKRIQQHDTTELKNMRPGYVFIFNNHIYLMIKRYPDISPYNAVDLESGEPEQLALNVKVVPYLSASIELGDATPPYKPTDSDKV